MPDEPDYKKLFQSACTETFLCMSMLSLALAQGDIRTCPPLMEDLSKKLRAMQGHKDA